MTSASVIVNTTYGPVNGSVISLKTNKTVITYLGIPFAKAGRFEDPVPPNKWSSVLQANKIDKICPQPNLRPSKRLLMNEDCLLLNVYVPANATSSSSLPVMLWIHGGAFMLGDTLGYDGSVLATEGDVIVVTAAYRLGVFGFLSANSDNLRGNYGMLDQIAALKWVNKNIARFGGDPNKVTIFGGSAGGMCVALLMLSPLSSGLYQNVIMQSGTAAALSSAMERNEADMRARSFAKAVGCGMSSLKACVKTKSVQEVLDAQLQVFSNPILLSFGPVVDGYFLPDSPVKLLQAGKFNKTNIIAGVTRDDGSIFISGVPGVMKGVNVSNGMSRAFFKEEITKRTWLRNQNSQVVELLIYQYTDWSNATDPYLLRQQFIDINSDATFKAPAILSAKAFVKEQSPTYFYQLETAPSVFPAIPFPLPMWFGVYHRADVVFTFGDPLIIAENLTTAAEIKLSKDIMTLWTNFAKTGNPNKPTPLGVAWPQYTASKEEYLGLSPNLTVRSKMQPDKMALWNELLPSIEETIKPTTSSHIPTTSDEIEDQKDNLVMVLAILSGVFGALGVILLVVLIVTCCKRKRRERDFEQPLNM
ncbi:hypothetical protein ACROYT_G030218 [Oculina patagonica]